MSGRRNRGVSPVQSQVYMLAFVAGSRTFQLRLPRAAWAAVFTILPLLGAVYLGATVYWIFHDDLLASLMRRQVDMQYAYEDRIGLLRHDIETITLRARSEEARFHTDLEGLTQRQVQTEGRTAVLVALSERMKANRIGDPRNLDDATSAIAKTKTAESNPLLTSAFVTPLPAGSRAYAPDAYEPMTTPPSPATRSAGKPHPEALDLRLDKDSESTSENSPSRAEPPQQTLHDHVSSLSATYDRLDAEHLRVLGNLRGPARKTAETIRAALAMAGLSADLLTLPRSATKSQAEESVGGPFVPLPAASDNSAFAQEAALVQTALEKSDDMRQLLSHVPLRQPLPGPLEVTSGFGARLDPFFGRLALHTGVDLRDDYGSPVRVTAAGVVITAGPNGGYGNMVEVDHGNGLTTRYAHLSAISVSVNQRVTAGTIVGRLGSTGRSTGPHLHYETRINGEPVDPERFLKAGAHLFD